MRTMDGYQYTFNGKGEYILVDAQDGDFILQARMAEPINTVDDAATSATVFTACSARQTGSTQVEMVMNQDGTDFSVTINGTQAVDKNSLLNGMVYCDFFKTLPRVQNLAPREQTVSKTFWKVVEPSASVECSTGFDFVVGFHGT